MKAFRLALVLLFAACPLAVWADLYGFVGPDGKIHLANEKLDARYELFLKGETRPAAPQQPAVLPPTELKYLPEPDSLADHIIYKRVQKSPNVARFDDLVHREAGLQKLEPALVKAVIAVESAYEPAAISPKGAVGLMQLIPGTAARYGVKKIADPQENVNGGTRYLRDLIAMFNGNLELALAGYNAGEGAVQKYRNSIPPFPETQAYVKLVLRFYAHFGGGVSRAAVAVPEPAPGPVRMLIPGRRNLPSPGLVPPGLTMEPRPAVAGEGNPSLL